MAALRGKAALQPVHWGNHESRAHSVRPLLRLLYQPGEDKCVCSSKHK